MIVEVRSYRTKPGRRAEFIRLFEQRTAPAQRAYGMGVAGPFLDVENPDRFTWLRAFPSAPERDRMKEAFYASDLWTGELEAVAMPLLEGYDYTLCEAAGPIPADWL